MKVLETIEAESEFNVVDDKRREADHQLVQAFNQNEKLLNASPSRAAQITEAACGT